MTTRTSTLPSDRQPPPLASDPITALRILGTGTTVPFPKDACTLGRSPLRELVVDQPHVSSLHCLVERRGRVLRVTDHGTHNKTFFRGEPQTTFEVGVGDTFHVGGTGLVPVTQPVQNAEPGLRFLLGTDAVGLIDAAVLLGLRSSAVVLIGEVGADHRALAEAMHAYSPRRLRPFAIATTLDELKTAFGAHTGAVFIDVDKFPKVVGTEPEVSAALGRVAQNGFVGIFVAASTEARVVSRLGLRLGDTQHLTIPPLRSRASQLIPLIEELCAGTSVVADLSKANKSALTTYRWPRNMDELREAAVRLEAINARGGSVRAGAKRLGIHHSTLQEWAERLGLTFADE